MKKVRFIILLWLFASAYNPALAQTKDCIKLKLSFADGSTSRQLRLADLEKLSFRCTITNCGPNVLFVDTEDYVFFLQHPKWPDSRGFYFSILIDGKPYDYGIADYDYVRGLLDTNSTIVKIAKNKSHTFRFPSQYMNMLPNRIGRYEIAWNYRKRRSNKITLVVK